MVRADAHVIDFRLIHFREAGPVCLEECFNELPLRPFPTLLPRKKVTQRGRRPNGEQVRCSSIRTHETPGYPPSPCGLSPIALPART